MTTQFMESLEDRCLLSVSVLAPGGVVTVDVNGNGHNEAILENLGTSAINYVYTGGQGFASVDITANGGSFLTNTFVTQVGTAAPATADALGSVKESSNVVWNWHTYGAVAGDTGVTAGSISTFEVGNGNLLAVNTTVGGIGSILLDNGDVTGNLYSSGSITKLAVNNLFGSVTAAQSIGEIDANNIAGSDLTAGTNLTTLNAGTITGTLAGTYISVGGTLSSLVAGTITAGANGTLYIASGGPMNLLSANEIDGGVATGGNTSYAEIDASGGIASIVAGTISGGQADGAGSSASLVINVSANGTALGDVGSLTADTLSTGQATNGASAGLAFNIAHDLLLANIGQITGPSSSGGSSGSSGGTGGCGDSSGGWSGWSGGSCGGYSGYSGCGGQSSYGGDTGSCDPFVVFNVGDNIVKFQVGTISPGTASAANDESDITFNVGNDFQYLSATQIDGGTAVGSNSTTDVTVNVGRDIDAVYAGTISGGLGVGSGSQAGVFFDAGRNISLFSVGVLSGTGVNSSSGGQTSGGGQTGCGGQSSCGSQYGGGGQTSCGGHSSCGSSFWGSSYWSGSFWASKHTHASVAQCKGDPVVQILAHNNIQYLSANTIVAGADGLVDILAGVDDLGNPVGGSIVKMIVNSISGDGGAVNIAADGSINSLQANSIYSGSGTVKVAAIQNMTVSVGYVQSSHAGGVQFDSGGSVIDVFHTISNSLKLQGLPPVLPTPVLEF